MENQTAEALSGSTGVELAIVGAGNMAEAIARGVLGAGLFKPEQLRAADVSAVRREFFQRELKILTSDRADAVASGARRLLLSVKPQQMAAVLDSLRPTLSPATLVISIAAGVSTRFIERTLGGVGRRVVRTMPNTPMLVGAGMSAIAAGSNATEDDLADARRIFAAGGSVVQVREEQIDAVTAVSGSGPAYFFWLVEQMVSAGVALGLSPDQSHLLAVQTALGSARMLVGSIDSPAELRRKVTSPGGTTQAAVSHLESAGAGAVMIAAVKAAAARSRELGV